MPNRRRFLAVLAAAPLLGAIPRLPRRAVLRVVSPVIDAPKGVEREGDLIWMAPQGGWSCHPFNSGVHTHGVLPDVSPHAHPAPSAPRLTVGDVIPDFGDGWWMLDRDGIHFMGPTFPASEWAPLGSPLPDAGAPLDSTSMEA
jgi:hypothetical protein